METLETFQETAGNGMETFLIFGYGLETFQRRFQAVSPPFKFPKRGTKFPLPFLEVSSNLDVDGSTELSMHQMEVLKDLRQG